VYTRRAEGRRGGEGDHDHAVGLAERGLKIPRVAVDAALFKAGFLRDQEVISLESIREHPFYADFLLPQGLLWCATALFSVDGSIWGATVHAGPDRDPFDDQDMETLRQLRVPLEAAVKRAALLGEERLRPLEDLLAACGRGLAVLDWNARIVAASTCGEALLEFDLSGPALDEALHAVGHVPLPPYIASKRADDERDRTDYQTVYAREPGAVAAPTAGLHFTSTLFEQLQAAGIQLVEDIAARGDVASGLGRAWGLFVWSKAKEARCLRSWRGITCATGARC
jgi:hypothetical protein